MGSFSLNSSVVYETDFPKLFGGYSPNPGFRAMDRGESSLSPSLVLDSERGELVKAPARMGQKAISEAKAMAALKSHSEAERRRRERINAHLATLRDLVPCTDKMDKATLLAEVISHVKELKRNATEASKSFVIPMEVDEVRVEPHVDGAEGGPFSIRVSLCCDYRPELLYDVRQVLKALHLKTVSTEISTLGGRVKNVFVISGCQDGNIDDAEVRRLLASSVHQALRSVLDKFSASEEFTSRNTLPNKRRRASLFDSSSSSS